MTDQDFAKSFGERLRVRREALIPAVSRTELARAIGVSGTTISNWEYGKFLPNSLRERKWKSFLKGREDEMTVKAGGRLRHG